MKDDPGARSEKFRYGAGTGNLTASEKAGQAMYSKLSERDFADGTVKVQAVEIDLELPGGAGRGNNMKYIHLSASLMEPSVRMLRPGTSSGTGGPVSKGILYTGHWAASATRTSCEVVRVCAWL